MLESVQHGIPTLIPTEACWRSKHLAGVYKHLNGTDERSPGWSELEFLNLRMDGAVPAYPVLNKFLDRNKLIGISSCACLGVTSSSEFRVVPGRVWRLRRNFELRLGVTSSSEFRVMPGCDVVVGILSCSWVWRRRQNFELCLCDVFVGISSCAWVWRRRRNFELSLGVTSSTRRRNFELCLGVTRRRNFELCLGVTSSSEFRVVPECDVVVGISSWAWVWRRRLVVGISSCAWVWLVVGISSCACVTSSSEFRVVPECDVVVGISSWAWVWRRRLVVGISSCVWVWRRRWNFELCMCDVVVGILSCAWVWRRRRNFELGLGVTSSSSKFRVVSKCDVIVEI